jgi:hypothetical protein
VADLARARNVGVLAPIRRGLLSGTIDKPQHSRRNVRSSSNFSYESLTPEPSKAARMFLPLLWRGARGIAAAQQHMKGRNTNAN